MKDKFNNFEISFDSNDDANKWFINISKVFPEVDKTFFDDVCNLILSMDLKLEGRFAANVKDLTLFACCLHAVTKNFKNSNLPNLAYVEIGSLFGFSAILADFAIKKIDLGSAINLLLIDPLNGYYDSENDLISSYKIDDNQLKKNLIESNVKNYNLLKGYSANKEIINEVKKHTIFCLFIDGDHSYQGLLNDWNNYHNFIVEGGYILIDNINDESWPSVDQVKIKILNQIVGKFDVIFNSNKTLILKKIKNISCSLDQAINIDLLNRIEKSLEKLSFKRFYNITQLKTTLNKTEAELTQKVSDLQQRNQDITQLKTTLNKTEAELTQKVSDLQQRNQDITQLKTTLNKTEAELTQKVSDLQQRNQDITQLKTTLNKTEAELTQKVSDLQQRNQDITQLKTTLNKTEAELTQKVSDLQQRNQDITQLKTTLNKTEAELTQKVSDLQQRNQDITQLKTTLNKTEAELTQKVSDLQQRNQDITQLKTTLNKTEAELTQKVSDLQQRNQDITQLKTTLNKTEAELTQKGNEVRSMSKKISDLEIYSGLKVKEKITVGIPVYFDHNRLYRTLDSIEKYKDFIDILIIDDSGKKNKFSNFFERLQKSYEFTVRYNEKNLGLGPTRNLFIENCKNKYITFVDCGDTLEDLFFRFFQRNQQKNPDIISFRLTKKRRNNRWEMQGKQLPNNKLLILSLLSPNQATARIFKTNYLKKNKYFL